MIEAMSAGLPVVTFDYKCGPRDIITPGTDGIIIKEGDLDSFADAILRLMSDNERRQQMGRAATTVVNRYSEERVMNQWISLFERLTY